MENNVDIKFTNEKFIVSLENGQTKVATPITRLLIEGTDTEYYYYAIDDDDDSEKVSILAQRIVIEDQDGKKVETLKDLENEEERQMAFQLFSETYKILKDKKSKEEK